MYTVLHIGLRVLPLGDPDLPEEVLGSPRGSTLSPYERIMYIGHFVNLGRITGVEKYEWLMGKRVQVRCKTEYPHL